MFEIILIIVAIVLLYKIITSYRLKNHDTVLAFTGGLGAGKSFMSVEKAVQLLKRRRREVWWQNLLRRKKDKLPLPMLYTSIPVKISRREWALELTPEHVMLQRKIIHGSVVFIDEIGAFCSQFDYREKNSDVFDEFVRFFRHYIQGYLICNEQCSENIVLQVRRRLNTVYNMMGFRKFLFVYWVKVRNITVSEEIKTIEEQNTEDNMRTLIGLMPLFRRYDTHCYSVRYDAVPQLAELQHKEFKKWEEFKMPKGIKLFSLTAKKKPEPTPTEPLPEIEEKAG